MFRDVIYVTEDYSIRIQDGYLIFRWWRSYVPKDVSEGKFIPDMTLKGWVYGKQNEFLQACLHLD